MSDLTRVSSYLQALLELAPSIGDATESLGWALAFFAGDEKDAMSLLTLGGWLVVAGSHCVRPEWSTDKCWEPTSWPSCPIGCATTCASCGQA